MAMNIQGMSGRGNIYFIPTEEIEVNWSANGRFTKPTPEELADLKASIRQHGQQQPVIIRTVKKEDGMRAVLVAGFCRVEAIRQLNEEGNVDPILVSATGLARVNDEDAFKLNIEENMRRKALSPVDIAYQIRRWESVYNKGADEIAAIYQRPVRWVHEHKKLLILDTPTMNEVHAGDMTMSAALDIAAMPEEKRTEVAEKAKTKTKNSKGKTDRAAVVEAAREAGMQRARGWSDLKKVIWDLAPRCPVAKAMQDFMEGSILESDLRAIMRDKQPDQQ